MFILFLKKHTTKVIQFILPHPLGKEPPHCLARSGLRDLMGGGGGVQWLSVAPGAQSQSQLWCGTWSRTRIYNQSWTAHKTSGYECEVQRGKAFCPSVPLIRLRPRPEGLLPVCPLLFQLWQEACQHAPCKLSISPTVNEEARRGTLSFKLLFQTQRLSAGHLPSSSRESPSLSISYSVEKKF